MPESSNYFTKENLDTYLNALSKQYRRLGGKAMPAEIVLIGGAAILVNYGFREMTTDADALIRATSSMKDAINYVGDAYDLPNGWLNADFMRTASYSPKLWQYSIPYRSFNHVLNVRTISSEYLIAMKLCSGRRYKKDLSDILGILQEHKERGTPIAMSQIHTAVCNLYGSWESIPEESRVFIDRIMTANDFTRAYDSICEQEKQDKELLKNFESVYPGTMNTENVISILESLRSRGNQQNQHSAKNRQERDIER